MAAAWALAYVAQGTYPDVPVEFVIDSKRTLGVISGSQLFDFKNSVLMFLRSVTQWLGGSRDLSFRRASFHIGEGFNELVDAIARLSGM
eukprot:8125105-Pyramimonas_sp.AAC.1